MGRKSKYAEDPEVNVIENDANELSFAEKLQAKLNQMSDDNATATKKLSFQATVKKEMNLFQSTNERSKNLNLLYMIL